MTNQSIKNCQNEELQNIDLSDSSLKKSREILQNLKAEKQLQWAHKQFDAKFVLSTSFGIQSAVLLNMVNLLKTKEKPTILWVDTGYLPPETYLYAEELTNKLQLNLKVVQSIISPARMEALYGKLWETKSIKNLEKYHLIRKIEPLEKAFKELDTHCWASGVRGEQTQHRSSMTHLDKIRGRLSIRPLLNWTKKDIYYYMKEHSLPQHPLFEKGYSTVGDWHSSGPDSFNTEGRNTRFGGIQEECGIHIEEKSNQ